MHARARLHVLLAAGCFGTTGTAQALGPAAAAPIEVGAARIVLGGALLILVAAAARATPARWELKPLLMAAAGVAVYQLAFFAAVADTGVAVGTIVALGSAPTLAGLLEWALTRRRPELRWAVATALACGGVALLAGGSATGASLPGIGLAVTAGGAYALYTLAAKRLLALGHTPERVMAGAFGLGALALAPVLIVSAPGWLTKLDGLALVLFLGVVPTALAYVLFARGLRALTASETATLTLAEPLTAALLGAAVLGERLSGAGLAGAALVLAGMLALAVKLPRRPPARVPVPDCGA
jgi:DME family drug/metabolite transporter